MRRSRVAVGGDHAAWELKDAIARFLRSEGHEVEDLGTDGPASVDYPDFARRVADQVAGGAADFGVALCGTGIGVSITANKVAGVRAALCHDTTTARLAREHNDANVLCIGARITGPTVALDIIRAWMDARFEGGRHQRRIDIITRMESGGRAVRASDKERK